MTNLKQLVKASVRRVTEHPDFRAWLAKQRLSPGDTVAFNNSFAFRELTTSKSIHYLSLTCNATGALNKDVQVTTGLRFNSNFRHFLARQPGLPAPIDLPSAIDEQKSEIGQIVFVLVSVAEDDMVLEQPLGRDGFDKVIWDPSQHDAMNIEKRFIRIRDVGNEEGLWDELKKYCGANRIRPSDKLRKAFAKALEQLQGRAVARLTLPTRRAARSDGVTDLVVGALRGQRQEYASAMSVCAGDPSINAPAFNEVLRIAYNFTNEAMTYLKLIMNVCDLKPLVLWGTIGEHYALSESLRELPWTRAADKPSLLGYVNTVGGARNTVFHNIFPFQKALSVALPDSALRAPELLIFSEHSRRGAGGNRLTYRDKDLVDVLLEFTRTRSRRVSPDFWVKNLSVMDRSIELIAATSRVLKAIYAAVA